MFTGQLFVVYFGLTLFFFWAIVALFFWLIWLLARILMKQ